MNDDEDYERKMSRAADLARMFADTEKFDRALDRMVPNVSGEQIDDAFLNALGMANELVAQDLEEEAGVPLVNLRERQLLDGSIAIHVIVEDPNARLYTSRDDDNVLVRTPDGELELEFRFPVGEIQEDDLYEDTVSEWVVYPEGYEPPEDDEEEESEDE